MSVVAFGVAYTYVNTFRLTLLLWHSKTPCKKQWPLTVDQHLGAANAQRLICMGDPG